MKGEEDSLFSQKNGSFSRRIIKLTHFLVPSSSSKLVLKRTSSGNWVLELHLFPCSRENKKFEIQLERLKQWTQFKGWKELNKVEKATKSLKLNSNRFQSTLSLFHENLIYSYFLSHSLSLSGKVTESREREREWKERKKGQRRCVTGGKENLKTKDEPRSNQFRTFLEPR